MQFKTDGGGFAFSNADSKLVLGSATWSTHLSQLGKVTGPLFVMTRLLPNVDYIAEIVGKRPRAISILAHAEASDNARLLKLLFPQIEIALHRRNNAKMVLVAPQTVWISTSDFGKSGEIETGIGIHSPEVFQEAKEKLFDRAWAEATRI